MKQSRLAIFALLLFAGSAYADVTPHPLFSNAAVLQRDTEVPVWGTSDQVGEKVTVILDDKPAIVTTAKDGKWMVRLPANPAGGPHTLTIAGHNKIVLKGILFGEVWICSGQSNMQMNLSDQRFGWKPEGDERAKTSVMPGLHFFRVRTTTSAQPERVVIGTWKPSSFESAKAFSLVGQYFGRELKRSLGNVPVGLIEADLGGTRAEAWMSATGLAKLPAVAEELPKFEQALKDYPALLEQFSAEKASLMALHADAVAKAKAANQELPPTPSPPLDPAEDSNSPSVLYNGMIAPLVPYAFRGVIWYQGESNNKKAKEYRTTFPALIADWRSAWGRGDFPFLFVQIAPFKDMSPEIREAQFLSLEATPNTAMVQTIDVGDANNIHPQGKEVVGKRLALAARRLVYGKKKLEYSGPLFAGASFAEGRAVINFTHAQSGLELRGVQANDFQIAGADKQFRPATAAIKANQLILWSPDVARPVAVRYGWSNVPNAALWNKDGLPASPFRSDVE